MELEKYLERIKYEGELNTDLTTLQRVHHQHLLSIPYENLSVQLGERLDISARAAFEKIVVGHRGGWCFEMNGLLQWALQKIGFEVMRVCGAVNRPVRGESAFGNHLLLVISSPTIRESFPGIPWWIADTGFGDGVREPFPLVAGQIRQYGFSYRLEALEDGHWRFHNHELGGAPNFDFRHEPANEWLLEAQCDWLQSSHESPFVQALVCQRFQPGTIEVLLGRMRRSITPEGVEKHLLHSADELNEVLRSDFDLNVDARGLWPSIVARHATLFPEECADIL